MNSALKCISQSKSVGSGSPLSSQRLEKFDGASHISGMTAADLTNLLERIKTWPEEAQSELLAVANQIEDELRDNEYSATQDELRIIDAAMTSLDAGEFATDSEVAAAFAIFCKE
ncbi:MAG TPA: hypothetical protein VEN78_15580 [Bradyrhizobium sp.]|nr:hypothetical protein [Bradyrhizobium sp.]